MLAGASMRSPTDATERLRLACNWCGIPVFDAVVLKRHMESEHPLIAVVAYPDA